MTIQFEECEPRPVFRGFQGGKLGQKQQPQNVFIIDFGEACRAYWAAIKKVREERTIFRSLEEPRDN